MTIENKLPVNRLTKKMAVEPDKYPIPLKENGIPDGRVDWNEKLLARYETPTVFKDEVTRPYVEGLPVKEPVLDAGCGRGYFTDLLLQRGLTVFGIDKKACPLKNENFHFIQGDLTEIELRKKFETVLLINILTTAPADERLAILKKIKDLKTPDGRAYIVNTNAEFWGQEQENDDIKIEKGENGIFKMKIKLIDGTFIEFPDYVITKEEMEECCREAGLEIVERKVLYSPRHEKAIFEAYELK